MPPIPAYPLSNDGKPKPHYEPRYLKAYWTRGHGPGAGAQVDRPTPAKALPARPGGPLFF